MIRSLPYLALLTGIAPNDTPPQVAAEIRWEPYVTEGVDDLPLEGELGRLSVPENRTRPAGPKIELAFVRFKTSNPSPGPTVVYLAGGPGASGIEHCVGPATGRLLRLLDTCDVIGLDQRGTGLSRPNLEQGPAFAWELATDRAPTRSEYVQAWSQALEGCAAHWESQGVDLSAYNTAESAEDLEDLRRALGLEQIMTWGESYGTHLAFAYLRGHAEHVARAVMVRVEGPDHTFKLPSTLQRHLERLHELVAADPGFSADLPDFQGAVRALLEELEHEPVTLAVEHEGQSLELVLGPFDLQSFIAGRLGFAFELRALPAHVQRFVEGDWSALGEHALGIRRGEVGSAMSLAMDCASGASPARLRRIELEAADPANLLGDAANAPYPGVCLACGVADLGDAFRAPFECDVPVLFVSGDLDARTPPENVDELYGGFSRGVHVRVENAGHESLEMLAPEYRALLSDFVHGKEVQGRTITLPPPRFAPAQD